MRSSLPKRGRLVLLTFALSGGLALLVAYGGKMTLAQEGERGEGPSPVSHLPIIRYDPTPVPPHPAALSLEPVVTITDFTSDTITDIAHAGNDRLFAVLREGVIKVIEADGDIFTFLDIQGLVNMLNWEQGLLGLAFHPDYPATPYFYVTYTSENENSIVLARYAVNPGNPNAADPNSQLMLMEITKPLDTYSGRSPVHNGGDLNFGPEGYLYMSVGDGGPDPFPGGPPGDPYDNSQRTDTLLGKILRIDVDGTAGGPPDCGLAGYTVPPGNPYVGGPAEDCAEIWAIGLRNPWRFSFDALTGDMFIGDVGEWVYEEVDFQPAGAPGGTNFGWHCYEGTLDYQASHPGVDCDESVDYTFPIFEYPHPPLPESGCSVTGGFVYRGSQYLSLVGHYLLADVCSRNGWLLYQGANGSWLPLFMGDLGVAVSTFGEGVDGALYAGEHTAYRGAQTVYRVVAR